MANSAMATDPLPSLSVLARLISQTQDSGRKATSGNRLVIPSRMVGEQCRPSTSVLRRSTPSSIICPAPLNPGDKKTKSIYRTGLSAKGAGYVQRKNSPAHDSVLLVPSPAHSNKSCTVCHTVFPELTAFGRAFKLNGYVFSKSSKPYESPPPVDRPCCSYRIRSRKD